jgi:hypothetical protein
MALFRFIAWVLLLVAMIALVSDLTRAANGQAFSVTSTLGYWKNVSPQSLATTATTIQRSIHPLLWDPVCVRLLGLPIWLLIGGFGLVMAVLGRKKRRVNIYAN